MDTAFVAIDTSGFENNDWNSRNGFRDTQDLKVRNVNSKNQDSKEEPFEILDLEIDRGCNPSSCWENPQSFLMGSAPANDIHLYRYHEIPSFLQGNPFIIKGYRAMLPFSLCYQRYVQIGTCFKNSGSSNCFFFRL